MAEIKTVIFDLGGVIVPLDFPNLYREISTRCGLTVDEIPKRIGATGLVIELETGRISGEDFSQRICEALGFSLAKDEFGHLWSTLFPSHTLIPEELLVSLKKNYRLLLLSNTNSLHFEMIRKTYPLTGHFDDYVLSYEVGAMKPSPRIYEEAITRSNVAAEECFFTDDIAAYVEGAQNAGLNAVQFRSYEQLTQDMDRYGIVWR
jgi:epoxide hydrolase-like predicted phosphatase